MLGAEQAVDEPVVAEHRDPGVGAHQVVHEEGQHHQRDQHVLPATAEDRDVVGDRVADQQAEPTVASANPTERSSTGQVVGIEDARVVVGNQP